MSAVSTAAPCCSPSSSRPHERRGFFGSFAHIGVPGGLFLASGAFAIASQLPDEAFLAWGWRACFLLSIVLLAIGAWIRLSVMETPAFQVVAEEREISTMPVTELFRRQPRRLLLGMGTRFIEGFTFNLFSVYLLAYAVKNVGVPQAHRAQRDHDRRRPGRRPGRRGRPASATGSVASGCSRPAPRSPCCFTFPARLARSSTAPPLSSGHRPCIGDLSVLSGSGLGPGPTRPPSRLHELFDRRYPLLHAVHALSRGAACAAPLGLTPLIAAWLVTHCGDGTL